MSKVYYKGYSIPYPLGTEEWKSFRNYAQTYYKEAIEIAKECTQDPESYRTLLNATISPLVYLFEKWQLMSIEDKLKYATPEYKAELERMKAEAQQVKERAGTA